MTTRVGNVDPRGALPAAAVVLAALILWLTSQVKADEIARYLGYELAFVLAPGVLLLRAINPASPGLLAGLAFGWALGLATELLFFILTAAFDVRDFFVAYPLIVGVPAAIVWRVRARPPLREPEPMFTAGQRWAIAGLCLTAFGFLGLTHFAHSPLPGTVDSVFYDPDRLLHLSIAAEALHDWPLASPQVAGEPFNYHYFVHLHMAAVSQVTGIDVPVVYLRLVLLPLISLLLLQLSFVGRAVTGIGWAGPITAALFLLTWELDLSIPESVPFLGVNLFYLQLSPSYVFGLVLFVPAIALLAGLVESSVLERLGLAGRRAAFALLVVLLTAVGGAKVVALPMAGATIFLYLVWAVLRKRRVERLLVAALGVTFVAFLGYTAALYGTEGNGVDLGLGGYYKQMPALYLLKAELPGSALAEAVFWVVAVPTTTAFMFAAPLLGLYWILGRGRPPLREGQRMLLACLVAGIPSFFLLTQATAAGNYFLYFGLCASLPVMAEGLTRGGEAFGAAAAGLRRRTLLTAGLVVSGLLGLSWIGYQLALDERPVAAYLLIYPTYLLVVGVLILWARRSESAMRPARVALVSVVVLIPASLDLVLDTVPETVRALREDRTLYDSTSYGLTRPAYEATVWIRDNTDDQAILSVSNQRTERAAVAAPQHGEYPAFTERRAFYEGWAYTQDANQLGWEDVIMRRRFPFPERRELEQRAFIDGDRAAVEEMQEQGVTHLIIDRVEGKVPRSVYAAGEVVFSNEEIDVIELDQRADSP